MRRVMICIKDYFKPFVSSWGALCVPEKYGDDYLLPMGWEQELTARGIEFDVIIIDVAPDEDSKI